MSELRNSLVGPLIALVLGGLVVGVAARALDPYPAEKKQGFALFFSDPKRQPVWQEGRRFDWAWGDCVKIEDQWGRATFQTCGVMVVRKMQEPEEPKK